MSERTHWIIPFASSMALGPLLKSNPPALPHLDALLARMSPLPAEQDEETSFSTPHERLRARALGLNAADGRTPWAAWQRVRQGLPVDTADNLTTDSQSWAFLTPCQVQVGADHVTLGDPAALLLDEAASRALLTIFEPWFAGDGISLEYIHPTLWWARGNALASLRTASLDRVLRRDVRAWQPQSDNTQQLRTLQRLQSEMQMLLYTHPFNDARAAQGLPPVNAFWLHGAGQLESAPPADTTEPRLLNDLRDAALRDDGHAWLAAWQALDAGPLQQLLEQLNAGADVTLSLCGERGALSWHNAPRSLWQKIQSQFRPQRFADLCEQL